jgi:hypothetical protein
VHKTLPDIRPAGYPVNLKSRISEGLFWNAGRDEKEDLRIEGKALRWDLRSFMGHIGTSEFSSLVDYVHMMNMRHFLHSF